jgi:phage-related minor tail protein
MQSLLDGFVSLEFQLEKIKVEGVEGLADGITELLLTGGKNFKEFAAGFIKQIAAMIIKALIFKAIMDAIKGFSSGVNVDTAAAGSNFVPNSGVSFAAHGGTKTGPTIVGERGPELLNLASASRITPTNQMLGMGGGGSDVVINGGINVVVKENKDETSQEQADNISKAIARDLRQMVQGELINQQRPGNILNPAGRTTFK